MSKVNRHDFVPYIAEFVGVLIFVFIGAGSIVAASHFNSFDGLTIAAAHGFAIFIMVAATANVSGGHLNPAVTWGLMFRAALRGNGHNESFKLQQGLGYILAQLAGAAAGASILLGAAGLMDGGKVAAEAVNYGTPALAAGLDPLGGFIYEMIFGFILVFVILRVAVEDKMTVAPLAIGMAVFADALMGGAFTGAAMNPARWFGPALVSGHWDNALLYIGAPMLGAIIAVIANDLIFQEKKNTSFDETRR